MGEYVLELVNTSNTNNVWHSIDTDAYKYGLIYESLATKAALKFLGKSLIESQYSMNNDYIYIEI